MLTRMKKCPRCDVLFHLMDRTRCLYCDTLLMVTVEDERGAYDSPGLKRLEKESKFYERMLKEKAQRDLARMQYLVGCYFRSRNLKFFYKFNRNNMKMGEAFPRRLIQPLDFTVFLQLPWLLVNLVDSAFFRGAHNGYCPRCKWKYHKLTDNQPHDPVECSYNQEYQHIVDDIISGAITKTEKEHRRFAQKKKDAGRRSAYDDLCARKVPFWTAVDIMTIWVSLVIILGLLILMMLPLFQSVVARIEV